MPVKRFIAALLALGMALLGGCAQSPQAQSGGNADGARMGEPPAAAAEGETGEGAEAAFTQADTLTLAVTPLTGCYSPFFARGDGDGKLLRLTQARVLTLDADGRPVSDAGQKSADEPDAGIAGVRVTPRDGGGATYRITMREDVRYADGSYADVDDLIFTYYVLLDPDYDGPYSLADCGIQGLGAYRTRTSPAIYARYEALFAEALAGEGDHAARAAICVQSAWEQSLAALTAECGDSFLDDYAYYALGVSPEEARADAGLLRAFVMWCAGLADAVDGQGAFRDAEGGVWRFPQGETPTAAELYGLFAAHYGSAEAYDAEMGTNVAARARERFIRECARDDRENDSPASSIEGLKRVDDYTLEITTERDGGEALETLCRVWLAPLHIYGDEALYDYEAGSFGFTYGDLAAVRAGNNRAVGAGPYALHAEAAGGPLLSANAYYFKGCPQIPAIRLTELPESGMVAAVAAGEADAALLEGSRERFEAVRAAGNSGKPLLACGVATDVYGGVCLNEDLPQSLRGGLARTLAAICAGSASEYFGAAARLTPLPALPEAEEAALSDTLRGALEAANSGGKGERYTALRALVSAGGSGDHPCYAALLQAAELLAPLGVTLTVIDEADETAFWAAVDGGEADIHCAAWHAGTLLSQEEAAGALEEAARVPVYQKQDLALFNTQHVDEASVPREQTVFACWLDRIETLKLQ